jgi:hypothetical protein
VDLTAAWEALNLPKCGSLITFQSTVLSSKPSQRIDLQGRFVYPTQSIHAGEPMAWPRLGIEDESTPYTPHRNTTPAGYSFTISANLTICVLINVSEATVSLRISG